MPPPPSPSPDPSDSAQETQPSAPPSHRRRGAALEVAVLEAAWEELCTVGYPALTLDGVAARAGTSRPVLARRWSDRVELVIAAIRHRNARAALDTPDTGTLRDDMLTLLRELSASVHEITGALSFVLADYFDASESSPSDLRERILAGAPNRLSTVIQRAIDRGEIDPDRLSPQIASLPVDLVRHRLIMDRTPVPDDTLTEIVDHIFLPLVLARETLPDQRETSS